MATSIPSSAVAGGIYALVVFAAGFVLGAIRVTVVAPAAGPFLAVLLETPFMLTWSWIVCKWTTLRRGVANTSSARAIMGAVAFVVLLSCELALSLATGRSVAQFLGTQLSAPGAAGLAAQLIFAAFPLVQL